MAVNPMNLCMGCMGESIGAPVCPNCGWQEGSQAESPLYLPPRSILNGEFLVGRVLGHGGFGITYLGWDINLARRVAVKEYFPSGVAIRNTGTPQVVPYSANMKKDYDWGLEKYLDEARVVAQFHNHPGIVSVQRFFQANGTAYLIMEYLEGMTFEKLLERRGGKITWETGLQVMMPVMDALREVHKAGILHRDISPDNVYLSKGGQIKVLDFGAARNAMGQQSKNWSIILKEGYAPEEQYRSKGNQGPWTDVYAVAATLYRAVTGEVPPAALDRQKKDELVGPRALGVVMSADNEAILLQALAVNAEHRFPDMGALQRALMNPGAPVLTQPPVVVRPQPQPQPIGDLNQLQLPQPLKTKDSADPSKLPIPGWLIAIISIMLLGSVAFFASKGRGPVVKSFTAQPAAVTQGEETTLSWTVENATEVEIDSGIGKQPAVGKVTIRPTVNSTYRLVAKASSGSPAESSVQVTVKAPPPSPAAEITSFGASPPAIKVGQSTVLSWSVRNAVEVSINGTKVNASGTAEVKPTTASNYTIRAKGADGAVRESTVSITIADSPTPTAPQIVRFEFAASTVPMGGRTQLFWSVRNATSVEITGLGQVKSEGTFNTNPLKQNTWAKIVAKGPGGVANGSAQVNVVTPNPIPLPEFRIVSFTADPRAVRQGQQTRLMWSVIGATNVSIDPIYGKVNPSGQTSLYPQSSERFVLTAIDATGRQLTAEVNVVVGGPPPPDPTPGASWPVEHDHDGAIKLNNNQPWRYCSGTLSVTGGHLRFQSQVGDGFDVPLSSVLETRVNRINVHGYRAFHVKLRGGGNYNFVPKGNVDAIVTAIIQAGGQ